MHSQITCSQNSPEWYKARLFRFTSSELHRLMTDPVSKSDKESGQLSETAKSYVYEKLAEYTTNGTCLDYKEIKGREVEWGSFHEDSARKAYTDKYGIEVKTCGFFMYNEYFGGSPDGLVGDDGILEIKCPYDSARHVKYLLAFTADEFKKATKEGPKYYAQIQGNLLASGRQWCDFISYDPRCQNPDLALKVIRISRDEEFIDKALNKLEAANKEMCHMKAQIVKILI